MRSASRRLPSVFRSRRLGFGQVGVTLVWVEEGELGRASASRASVGLAILFVGIPVGLIVVSQFEHEFRVNNQTTCNTCPYEENHRAWNSISGTQYERYWRWFVGSRSQMQTDMIKAGIRIELEDKRTLARADPATVRLALFLAILLSPELLILAVAGGWWASTAPLAMLCGLGAALCHDFLKMHLKYLEQFPSRTFPMALSIGVVVSLLVYVTRRSLRKRRAQA